MNYEAVVKAATANRLKEINFRDKSLIAGVDLGRLAEECFGYENYRHFRKNRELPFATLSEAAGAVSMANFVNITGQIIFSRVLDAYQGEQYVFTNLIPKFPTPFQDGEKLPGFAREAGQTQDIGEGKPYPILGITEDFIQTPPCTKRGGIIPVTREAIFGDRTGELLNRVAPALGEDMGIAQEEQAVDAVIDENRTIHRYNWKNNGAAATYQLTTPWINDSASTPLVDWTSVNTLEQLFNQMLDPFTGKPIVITPKHLVVTMQNIHTAKRIIAATNNRTGVYPTTGTNNNLMDAPSTLDNYQVVTSRYLAFRLATDTHWFLGDIAKAVNYMENWPLELTQAPPGNTLEFNNDIALQYKASRKGEYVVVQPRALVRGKA